MAWEPSLGDEDDELGDDFCGGGFEDGGGRIAARMVGGTLETCEEGEDDENFDLIARPVTASCIHGIIARATDELGGDDAFPRHRRRRQRPDSAGGGGGDGGGAVSSRATSASRRRGGGGDDGEDGGDSWDSDDSMQEYDVSGSCTPSCCSGDDGGDAGGRKGEAAAAQPTPSSQQSPPQPESVPTAAPSDGAACGGGSKRARPSRVRCRRPRPAPNELLVAEIARVLAAPRRAAEVRKYAAAAGGGFGRVPAFVRPLAIRLEAEQRYMDSLREPREASRQRVKLLPRGEKEAMLGNLRKQFQRAVGHHQAAKKGTPAKAELEAEVARIKKDLDSLNRPYVFVEDTS